jgi:hypothetical protein
MFVLRCKRKHRIFWRNREHYYLALCHWVIISKTFFKGLHLLPYCATRTYIHTHTYTHTPPHTLLVLTWWHLDIHISQINHLFILASYLSERPRCGQSLVYTPRPIKEKNPTRLYLSHRVCLHPSHPFIIFISKLSTCIMDFNISPPCMPCSTPSYELT